MLLSSIYMPQQFGIFFYPKTSLMTGIMYDLNKRKFCASLLKLQKSLREAIFIVNKNKCDYNDVTML